MVDSNSVGECSSRANGSIRRAILRQNATLRHRSVTLAAR